MEKQQQQQQPATNYRCASYSQLHEALAAKELSAQNALIEVQRRIVKRQQSGAIIPNVTVAFHDHVAALCKAPLFAKAYPELVTKVQKARQASQTAPIAVTGSDADAIAAQIIAAGVDVHKIIAALAQSATK